MPAPAVKPPKMSEFPLALREHMKKIIDYIEKTHIEDVKIQEVTGVTSHTVEFTRSETGVIMNIKLSVLDCPAPEE